MKFFFFLIFFTIGIKAADYTCRVFYKSPLEIDKFSFTTENGNFVSSRNLMEKRDEIFQLYSDAYSKFSLLMFSNPTELIEKYPIGILYMQDNVLAGILLFRETRHGLKLGVATAKPTKSTLLAFRTLINTLNSKTGWYTEVSGNSFRFMRPLLADLQPTPTNLVKLLFPNREIYTFEGSSKTDWPKEIKPFVYQRTIKIGESVELNEKVMLGTPIIF